VTSGDKEAGDATPTKSTGSLAKRLGRTAEERDRKEEDPIGRAIAWNIKELRVIRRWEQDQLAEELRAILGGEAVNKSTISRWETQAKAWNPQDLMALCMVFGVNLADLMYPGDHPDLTDTPTVLGGDSYFEVWRTMFATVGTSSERWENLEKNLSGWRIDS
jgi:transcriptional regulator with XRE-family HTH domain